MNEEYTCWCGLFLTMVERSRLGSVTVLLMSLVLPFVNVTGLSLSYDVSQGLDGTANRTTPAVHLVNILELDTGSDTTRNTTTEGQLDALPDQETEKVDQAIFIYCIAGLCFLLMAALGLKYIVCSRRLHFISRPTGKMAGKLPVYPTFTSTGFLLNGSDV